MPGFDEPLLLWDGAVPRSSRFDDVYYSRDDGLRECRHVFIDHNDLPRRFKALPDTPGTRFSVAETGFGTGLNFLALWQCWEACAPTGAWLHVMSVEKFPLDNDSLARAHAAWPELSGYAQTLRSQLPRRRPGVHRLVFASARITLTLLYGDASEQLTAHEGSVDAWFLDGFAPSRNPDLWTPALFQQLARLSHADTTLATFTAAGDVRRGLQGAGFEIRKVAGFGRKRDMLAGRYRAPSDTPPPAPWFALERTVRPGSVIVVGAGLAGAAAARALASRGLTVTVLDAGETIASGASGNPVGMTYLRLTDKNTPQNRYYRDAYLLAVRQIPAIMEHGGSTAGSDWNLNGILKPGLDQQHPEARPSVLADAGNAGLARWLQADEASHAAGIEGVPGALLLEDAGWLNPATFCRHLLAHPAITVMCRQTVTALEPGHGWNVHTHDRTWHADAVVLANSLSIRTLSQAAWIPLRAVRGQVTMVKATPDTQRLARVLNYDGYLTPAWQGVHCVGATFQPNDEDTTVREGDNDANLAELAQALPVAGALFGNAPRWGRASLRAGSPDYLPVVGALPDEQTYCDHWRDSQRQGFRGSLPPPLPATGLWATVGHGSRGITSCLLAAEILCHRVLGEPAPVDREVLEAVDPGRFLIRRLKRDSQGKKTGKS